MNPITEAAIERARTILHKILDHLTFCQEAIEITTEELGRGYAVMLNVRVSRPDMARLIGKQGANIRALTDLMHHVGDRAGIDLRINVTEPSEGKPDRARKFSPQQEWDSGPVRFLFEQICEAVFAAPAIVRIEDGHTCNSLICIETAEAGLSSAHKLKAALASLANSIGKANGRIMSLELVGSNVGRRTR